MFWSWIRLLKAAISLVSMEASLSSWVWSWALRSLKTPSVCSVGPNLALAYDAEQGSDLVVEADGEVEGSSLARSLVW